MQLHYEWNPKFVFQSNCNACSPGRERHQPHRRSHIPVVEGIIAPQTCKSAPVSFLFFKMAIKIPLRFIIITPMYTSHAHLLQDRNPLTSVEGSCFPSQLVFLSLVRAFVASSSHQCHELHTPVRMPELTPRFLFVFSLAFMCILNRHWYSLVRTNAASQISGWTHLFLLPKDPLFLQDHAAAWNP